MSSVDEAPIESLELDGTKSISDPDRDFWTFSSPFM